MAPKKDTAGVSTFSFEVVAVLVAVLKKKGANLGVKDYQQMAELDGTRSAFAFDHMFRKVKARANELVETFDDAGMPKKKSGNTGSKSKSGQKRKLSMDDNSDSFESNREPAMPSKKIKAERTSTSPFDEQLEDIFN